MDDFDDFDDFDDEIWKHKKHKMTKYGNDFNYYIKKNIVIKNIRLKIKYNENYDKKVIFNNLLLVTIHFKI